MRKSTPQISVFNLNAGKYGPEKTPYLDNFQAVPVKNFVLADYLYRQCSHRQKQSIIYLASTKIT